MAKAAKELVLVTSEGQSITLRVQQLPARRSLKLLHRLAKYVTPALSKIDNGISGMTMADVASAVDQVLNGISEDDMTDIIERLMEGVSVNGAPLSGVFDILFQGETKNVFKLWRFVLEVNYADFFGDLVTASQKFKAASQSPSQNPSVMSGLSGDLSQKGGQA